MPETVQSPAQTTRRTRREKLEAQWRAETGLEYTPITLAQIGVMIHDAPALVALIMERATVTVPAITRAELEAIGPALSQYATRSLGRVLLRPETEETEWAKFSQYETAVSILCAAVESGGVMRFNGMHLFSLLAALSFAAKVERHDNDTVRALHAAWGPLLLEAFDFAGMGLTDDEP